MEPTDPQPAEPQDQAREAELAGEQEHVTRAFARLEELRAQAAAAHAQGLRGHAGTPQAVYERDVTVAALISRSAELDAAGEGLVFGRLDLVAAGGGAGVGEVLRIGRIGLRTAEQEPIVVDWRAPAAAAFYRATAAEPQGVVRRRVVSCRGQRVVGVEDDLLDPERLDALAGSVVVGDGAFLAALSRERGPRMRDIVATIQREQDEAVRAPDDGAVVVTGGPGTGKTAVALHRVAFLMYARRDRYARRGVLVVGPSSVFMAYVSAVLPSLGETAVRLSALGGLVAGVEAHRLDAPAVAAVKGSARMATVLARAVRRSAQRRVPDLTVRHAGIAVTVRGADAADVRARLARQGRPHNPARQAAVEALADHVWTRWSRAADARDWSSERRRDERTDLRAEIADLLARDERGQAFLQAYWPVLTPTDVLGAVSSGELVLAELARDVLDPDETAVLAAAWSGDRSLTVGDVALLDELATLLGPPPAPSSSEDDEAYSELPSDEPGYGEVTTHADRSGAGSRAVAAEEAYTGYAHVVVDEAQDVTPMQWRMLARRGAGATWTVVGDWAQSAWLDLDEARSAMARALERRVLREFVLTTNYRTTAEIAALAAGLLARIDPDAVAPRAVRSTGHEPLLRLGVDDPEADLHDVLRQLLSQVEGSVGVIVPLARARAVSSALAAYGSRVVVVDAMAAKGLEFDGCVVLAPEDLLAESPTGLRALYVALTRATQRLVVLSGDPAPVGLV